MSEDKLTLLKNVFQNFRLSDLKSLEKQTSIIKLKRGQPLFLEGDEAKYLYAVVSGSLKIVRQNSNGHSVITRIVGPKKLVGLREFFANFIYVRSSIALEDCKILTIRHNAITTLINKSSKVGAHFIRLLATELTRMENMLESHLNRSAKKRLANILYDFYHMFTKPSSKSFRSPLKRKDLAELAGMTPETVSRILSEMKKLKILDTKGRLFFILDSNALKRYEE